jgi:hypothetical protein
MMTDFRLIAINDPASAGFFMPADRPGNPPLKVEKSVLGSWKASPLATFVPVRRDKTVATAVPLSRAPSSIDGFVPAHPLGGFFCPREALRQARETAMVAWATEIKIRAERKA